VVQPTKSDEVELFRRLRQSALEPMNLTRYGFPIYSETVRTVIAELQIPEGRARYIFDKWNRKGWWDPDDDGGRNPDGGFITEAAPDQIGVPAK
jgi:hypothetical protein